MADFGKVAVLLGGDSAEREVSLNSGKAVLNGLRQAGVDAHAFDPAEIPLEELKNQKFERAFIVLHGRGGEDGSIQGYLQHIGLPYTGAGVLGSALAMDKVRSKYVFTSLGVPTAPYRVVHRGSQLHPQHLLDELGGKVICKPANEGSSVGMQIADSEVSLSAALIQAFKYDPDVLVEQYISGPEYTVSILGEDALPVIEMRTPRQFYDYEAKYQSDTTEYLCPAPLDDEQTRELQAIAVKAFNALGVAGWGRVDVMRDEEGQWQVLEVNTVPGMTEKSLVPMAAAKAGYSFSELVVAILAQTLIEQ